MGWKLELDLEWSSCLPQLTRWTAGSARSAGMAVLAQCHGAAPLCSSPWGKLGLFMWPQSRFLGESWSMQGLLSLRLGTGGTWLSFPSHGSKQIIRPDRGKGEKTLPLHGRKAKSPGKGHGYRKGSGIAAVVLFYHRHRSASPVLMFILHGCRVAVYFSLFVIKVGKVQVKLFGCFIKCVEIALRSAHSLTAHQPHQTQMSSQYSLLEKPGFSCAMKCFSWCSYYCFAKKLREPSKLVDLAWCPDLLCLIPEQKVIGYIHMLLQWLPQYHVGFDHCSLELNFLTSYRTEKIRTSWVQFLTR